jgi:hypothetical protein
LLEDGSDQVYQSLAMTEELREALFPTAPRMVSAIFERPAPAPPASHAPAATPLAKETGQFPII